MNNSPTWLRWFQRNQVGELFIVGQSYVISINLNYNHSYLQCFNTIQWHVICQCIFNFFEGFVVNGVINVVLVALEKRYSLPSSKSGVIASSNDFGAIVCVTLVGYFGEQRHKPKLMGIGILLMAVGCFVFALPQFIGDKYEYTVSGELLH